MINYIDINFDSYTEDITPLYKGITFDKMVEFAKIGNLYVRVRYKDTYNNTMISTMKMKIVEGEAEGSILNISSEFHKLASYNNGIVRGDNWSFEIYPNGTWIAQQ